MDDRESSAPDPEQLLTALATEHFTLQGARSQTMSESSARASVFVFSVSSALVALGFIGQVSEVGDVFYAFALTVLPTLYLLGTVTFVRLVECGAEDFRYGQAINRIRGYYQQIAGERANLFMLSGHDDPAGVFDGDPRDQQRRRRQRSGDCARRLLRRPARGRRRGGRRRRDRLRVRMAALRGSTARGQRADRAVVPSPRRWRLGLSASVASWARDTAWAISRENVDLVRTAFAEFGSTPDGPRRLPGPG
jgi:hypothetical protein